MPGNFRAFKILVAAQYNGVGVAVPDLILILYAASLLWLCLHMDARGALHNFDTALGLPLPEKTYGDKCELAWENVKAVVLDRFVLAHTGGWICGTMLLRDVNVAWVVSILFELLEITFTHWQPNFEECWWDRVVVDVLICNALGIYAGRKLLQTFCVPTFDWFGPRQPVKIMSIPLTIPLVLRCPRRFCCVLLLTATVSLMMLNAFFLKAALRVPCAHWLNAARLALWYCTSPAAWPEHYALITRHASSDSCSTAAKQTTLHWRVTLCSVTIALESGLCFTLRRDTFAAPWPSAVVSAWAWAASAIGLYVIMLWRFQQHGNRNLAVTAAKKRG